jgi:2-polyprenyl-6-methoxyphenol hydroxylase-like FAD-dependent oxidoreductase
MAPFHPSLFELQDASQTSAIQVFSAPPTIAEWTPNARITLMGDTIHTLSPAGGVGAVTTLKDAAGLTKILAEQGLSDASIGAYEAAMRAYASASVARSFAGAHKLMACRRLRCVSLFRYNRLSYRETLRIVSLRINVYQVLYSPYP